ncbi:MAG: aminodeoxychorismate synthase component I [Chromatiaceae bacterium]|jgi:para-aminobenzoate synthetase component I
MTELVVQEVPYRPDSTPLFDLLAHRSWPVFLDSGRPYSTQGRYDIVTADPRTVLVTRGLKTEIRTAAGARSSLADPFALLQEEMSPARPAVDGLPFCGGAVGYFGYDLGRRIERIPRLAEDAEHIPDMAVGIYEWALVVDHHEQRSRLVASDRSLLREQASVLATAWNERRVPRPRIPFRVLGPVRPNLSHGEYLAAIARIKHYIREGDCYQVNFAQRFSAAAEGDPWHAYQGLRRLNPAPFAAYLSTPYCQVMCSSPERFLRVRSGLVETKPIKGTLPRGKDPIEDLMLADALRASAKDRAENLMIVDLLRNDLGRVCAIGSIQVPRLFALESFTRVHHLVSTVRGRLAEGRTPLDLLRACFPGGSITGAPKVRAMEIIEELEPHRRGVYCGAIGYLGFDGAMDTNIAIRTLVHSDGVTRLWAGGGIVADSDPESEYRETYHKAAPLLDLLERLHLADVGS